MFYMPMKYAIIQVLLTKLDLVYNHDNLNLMVRHYTHCTVFPEKGYLRPDDGLRK